MRAITDFCLKVVEKFARLNNKKLNEDVYVKATVSNEQEKNDNSRKVTIKKRVKGSQLSLIKNIFINCRKKMMVIKFLRIKNRIIQHVIYLKPKVSET